MTTLKDRRQAHPGMCIVSSIAYLLTSAVLLIAGLAVWQLGQPSAQTDAAPLALTAKDLVVVAGSGIRAEEGVQVTPASGSNQAIIAFARHDFTAEDYPYLQYHLTGSSPDTRIALYWRSEREPEVTRFTELPAASSVVSLEQNRYWNGRLTHLGLSIQRPAQEPPLGIADIRFSPPSTLLLLKSMLSSWTGFEGWRHSSINFVFNSAPNPPLSPVLAAACWMLLALFLYGVKTLFFQAGGNKHWCAPTLIALVLVPWLLLHARWQSNLLIQLTHTYHQFGGKNEEERHLAAEDSNIYRYAAHLKQEVLPPHPVRMFLLRNEARDYSRLKLQYYLLPHNIYNYGQYPMKHYLHEGDYILTMGEIPGLGYDTGTQLLKWPDDGQVHALRLDKGSLGTLYQVFSATDNTP